MRLRLEGGSIPPAKVSMRPLGVPSWRWPLPQHSPGLLDAIFCCLDSSGC
jgi:hypothetical protein